MAGGHPESRGSPFSRPPGLSTRPHSPAESAHLAALAAHLSPSDRELLTALYMEGRSMRSIASLQGIDPWELRRRVARLLNRISSPAFLLTIRLGHELDPRVRAVARECFVEGRPVRVAAARLRMSVHAVRRERLRILLLAEAMRVAGRLDLPALESDRRRSA